MRKVADGLCSSIYLNWFLIVARRKQKKVCVFMLQFSNQCDHIGSVISELSSPSYESRVLPVILVYPTEIERMKARLDELGLEVTVSSYYSATFLFAWDIVIGIDQRMRYPVVSLFSGTRICMFHGQPSKGNVYSGFNHKQIDGLFFYGPLMREYFEVNKEENEHWAKITTWNVGQPKSDNLFLSNVSREEALRSFCLDPEKKTVFYAPSFESCGSLATVGSELILALIKLKINVIIKPHPSFYRAYDPADSFFLGVPHCSEWKQFSAKASMMGNVVFPIDYQLSLKNALYAADVMVTDHSGVAFDAILKDKPVIYYDCPEFFSRYLPSKYGIDGEQAKTDLFANAGRDSGEVVADIDGMLAAIQGSFSKNDGKRFDRRIIAQKLLYNPGSATDVFCQTIVNITKA